jgi:hypothetical protein
MPNSKLANVFTQHHTLQVYNVTLHTYRAMRSHTEVTGYVISIHHTEFGNTETYPLYTGIFRDKFNSS